MCYFIKIAAFLCFLPLHYDSAAFLTQKESLFPHPLESELSCDLLWSKECGKGWVSFSPFKKVFAVGLSHMAFIMLRYIPSMFTFRRLFIINGCWKKNQKVLGCRFKKLSHKVLYELLRLLWLAHARVWSSAVYLPKTLGTELGDRLLPGLQTRHWTLHAQVRSK